eukprot:CAMPEP_0204902160 /NCGR_PEP_ID=MMETSP1397-20131031/3499_1 /ASSEMBLY_ACC=CAM_ASM_000891 /TAXON_ID=49980 /ORGANISM="Climacostomum Climacostomum virens, Strain Stock W-24" /LENGTH=575 /DNA_ID=CAMNT_0052070617 /DNA_START=270 /DNA_END=1993 /DNA_ORIENTATION=-
MLDELTKFDVKGFLIETINFERKVKGLLPKLPVVFKISTGGLAKMYKEEAKHPLPEVECETHRNPGVGVISKSWRAVCPNCIQAGLTEEEKSSLLELARGEELLDLMENAFRLSDSFKVPPHHLKFLVFQSPFARLRILKSLAEDKLYMPYCPICLRFLTNENARKFPCGEANHLICADCEPKSRRVICVYDGLQFRNETCSKVSCLAALYKTKPVCPVCSEGRDLRVLRCNHSFCTLCIGKLRMCPVCEEVIELDAENYVPDPFLDFFAQLKCINDERAAVKMSLQTCQIFCEECSNKKKKLHTFQPFERSPLEFLDGVISSLVERITNQISRSRVFVSIVQEHKDIVKNLSPISRELLDLLEAYPNISLRNRTNLLYYLKSDLTNCETPGVKGTVGWRIPSTEKSYFKVAMRFNEVLPPLMSANASKEDRRPSKVDLDMNQIEVVGLRAKSPFRLLGLVLGTPYGSAPLSSLDYFEIYTAIELAGSGMSLTVSNELYFSFAQPQPLDSEGNHRVVLFNDLSFDIIQGTSYIFKFKLSGCPAFHRGNPYTVNKKSPVSSPDNLRMTFEKATCLT